LDRSALGLGNIGGEVALIGHAFGMRVVAWSENLTTEKAAAAGAEHVRKDELFRKSDVLTVHSCSRPALPETGRRGRTRADEATAWLANTSRGPIVHDSALTIALREHQSPAPP
jgi:phosphoglycerate dehydrogenase-like enzyme